MSGEVKPRAANRRGKAEPAATDVRGPGRRRLNAADMAPVDALKWRAVTAALPQVRPAVLAEHERWWTERSGLVSDVRRRQIDVAHPAQVHVVEGILELPVAGAEPVTGATPADRLALHPVAIALARRRYIQMATTGATVPGLGDHYYPAALEGTAEDGIPARADLQQLITLAFGEVLTPVFWRGREGKLVHNSLPWSEWMSLDALAGASLADLFGPAGSQLGPPRPSSRRRNTIRTVDSTLATRLATLVNEWWHSAYYQQRHHNTAALTSAALRREAQALAGGGAAPIGGPDWASSIAQLWAADPGKAALTLHLLFLAARLDDFHDRPGLFQSTKNALVQLADLTPAGVLDISWACLMEHLQTLRELGQASRAQHWATTAAKFTEWAKPVLARLPDLAAAEWCGRSMSRRPAPLIVSLAWPAQIARIRSACRTDGDSTSQLALDLLVATAARLDSILQVDGRSAKLHGQDPYLDLYIGVKAKLSAPRTYRARFVAPPEQLVTLQRRLDGQPLEDLILGTQADENLRRHMSIEGRPVHRHDIRRLVLTYRMIRAAMAGDPDWVANLVADANWKDLQSLGSYGVALDWLGNGEAATLLFAPSLAWRCTPVEARALSGLPAAVARHRFPGSGLPTLGAVLDAQAEFLNGPLLRSRTTALGAHLGRSDLREIVAPIDDGAVELAWLDSDDKMVARGLLLIGTAGQRQGAARRQLNEAWTILRRRQGTESWWVLAPADSFSRACLRMATVHHHFSEADAGGTLLIRPAPQPRPASLTSHS